MRAFLNSPGARRTRPGVVACLLGVLLVLLLSHPLIHGDGIAYFIYVDSISRDGDLDLTNQVVTFAPAIIYPFALSPTTHTPVTPFPFGLAYLLAPFHWLGSVLARLPVLNLHPEHFVPIQGLPLAYSLATMLGALCYTAATVALAYGAARRIAPMWAAALAAVACLVGTPLLYYTTVEPLTSHLYGTFALALAFWLIARRAEQTEQAEAYWPNALAIGLALGLAVLIRWQLVLYALPMAGAVIWHASRSGVRALATTATWVFGGLGSFCGVCMLYFWRYFGAVALVPNDAITGQHFIGLPRFLPNVLFAAHNGWLSWSPIAALGAAGLIGVALCNRGWWRALALAGLLGIALQVVLNASLDDWFGGWAFGQRRMVEAYPLLVVGCAWSVGHMQRKPLVVAFAALGALFGAFLLVAHLYYTHTSSHPEGGGIGAVSGWLITGPHGPAVFDVFRDRYGPWAWAMPER